MMSWSMAGADRKSVTHRLGYVPLGTSNRLLEGEPARESCRDRRRVGTTRPVCESLVEEWGLEGVHLRAVKKNVDGAFLAGKMPAFRKHGLGVRKSTRMNSSH